jgi:Protein of unknown function (DUF1761)
MTFAGMNYLAVLVAAVVGFVFGAVWYGVLGRQWLAAQGRADAATTTRQMPPPLHLAINFIALLVMAYLLAGLVGHLGAGQVTLKNGAVSGFFLWLGFVLTTLVVNYLYQGRKPALMAIDGAHWLGVLLLEGAVIGGMGV